MHEEDIAPGGGGTLKFPYIRRLGPFFGLNFFNFNIFGGFRKMKILGGLSFCG